MAAKPRVHEVAHELGIDSKTALKLLRELGVYVKSPSSTMEPPVARKLRALVEGKVDPEPPNSTHPDAVAAKARRDVVRRSDSDWAGYGFSDAEKGRWIGAGIPEDKAHIAAMCRDSEKRGMNRSRLIRANLRLSLGDGQNADRVIDALLSGTNALRTQERLASKLGTSITDVNPDLLRLTVSGKVPPEDGAHEHGLAFRGIEWEPQNCVRLADAVVDQINLVRPTLTAHWSLRGQIDRYRQDGTISPLLAAFARVHGVFRSGELLDTLCDGVAGTADEYAAALAAFDLIERAVSARRFYHLRREASEALQGVQSSTVDALPPSPEGVAFLAEGVDPNSIPARIVSWETDSHGDIRCLLISKPQVASLQVRRALSWGRGVETWQPGSPRSPERPASAFLDAFAVRRTRPLGQSTYRSRGNSSAGGTASTTGEVMLRDIVVSYFPRDGVASSGESLSRRSPDHRWVVRGHWRRQWYPSEKAHRPVWIEEHESGPADHPLLLSERVEVH